MSNEQLDAIRDAWDKETGEGRDEELARSLADALVAAEPDQFEELSSMSLEDCVKAVDIFRRAGMTDSQWKVEAWLLHRFEPQVIGGAAEAKVRIVPGA